MEFDADLRLQETLNYWKQLPHILKYFRAEEDPNARRPQNFMTGFLEVSSYLPCLISVADTKSRVGTECRSSFYSFVHIPIHHKETPRFSPHTPCNAVLLLPPPSILLGVTSSYAFIWSMKLSLSSWNFSETTSHRSIRSLKPFSSASTAVVPST